MTVFFFCFKICIGKTVTWDGATQSVYLGEKPGDVQYLMDVCPPYDYNNKCTIKNNCSAKLRNETKNYT